MSLRLGRFLLLVVHLLQVAAVVEPSPAAARRFDWRNKVNYGLKMARPIGGGGGAAAGNCHGKIGECIDEAEEMMMDSKASQQALAIGQKFVSYEAFRKDHVPCRNRGQSYSSCMKKS